MAIPTTEDIVVLRDLIDGTELDPEKDSMYDALVIFDEARRKLDQAERTLRWALSNCGITESYSLEPTMEVIATESAREHARLGRK